MISKHIAIVVADPALLDDDENMFWYFALANPVSHI